MMNTKAYIPLLLMGTALLMTTACSEDLASVFSPRDNKIRFTANADETVDQTTRGMAENRVVAFEGTQPSHPLFLSTEVTQRPAVTRGTRVESAAGLTSFGVSAIKTSQNVTDEQFAEATPDFFYNLEATRNASDVFEIAQDYFWPSSSEKLFFYAYAPYGDSNVQISDQDAGGAQKVSFTVDTNVANQVDLMTANTETTDFLSASGSTNKSAVPLSFHHELTAIRFVIGEQWLAGSIKSVGIYNVHGKGTMTIGANDASKWVWKNKAGNDVAATDDFVLTVDKSGLSGDEDEEFIDDTDLYFLMIPQSFDDNDDAYIEVKYQDNSYEYTVTAPLKGQAAWTRNTTVTYAISSHELKAPPSSSDTNGHAYVDLGNPSCYYATMNVGASSEGDWGSYFAWGETTTKSSYTESNYTASGISADLSISQDAARAQWGGAWRMPTKAELQWLIDNCTWTWTTSGGNDGYRITSNISGYTSNSIFLPAAGYYVSSVGNRGTYGTYWSSTYYESSNAWTLGFNSSDKYVNYNDRYSGRSVRAVLSMAGPPSSSSSSMSNPDGAVSFTSSQGVNSQISRTITCTNCSVSGVSVSGSGFSVICSGNTVTVMRTSTSAISGSITVTGTAINNNYTNPSSITISVSGEAAPANGHAYVDLGNPSCYYATMNVGASSEGDWGSYFAWGETTTKSSYTSSNYTASGISTDLSISQDAARAQWGGAWRMPTKAELQWLKDNCTWTWTTSGGNNGYRVTSKISGYTSNSIFLPAAGSYHDGSSGGGRGEVGSYWSSTYGYSSEAWNLFFAPGSISVDYFDRYFGLSVRAVLSK